VGPGRGEERAGPVLPPEDGAAVDRALLHGRAGHHVGGRAEAGYDVEQEERQPNRDHEQQLLRLEGERAGQVARQAAASRGPRPAAKILREASPIVPHAAAAAATAA